MPLDPQARLLLDDLARTAIPPELLTLEARRADIMKALAHAGPIQQLARLENRLVPGPNGEIPVRIYVPDAKSPMPVLVFFHGGGWVVGNLDSHDPLCRAVANGAGCVVVSVDYRLAPEHPYPAAPEDCYTAARWVAENAAELGVDASRIAVGGDSAGGNLAAATALIARDRNGPALAYQWLIYPVTDYCDPPTPSYLENAEGYGLTRETMIWFWNQYTPDTADAVHAYASVLRAPDLSGLPPALVITAEYDVLRDEALAYAERLREAGVPVQVLHVHGQIHGFANRIGVLDTGREALQQGIEALKTALSA